MKDIAIQVKDLKKSYKKTAYTLDIVNCWLFILFKGVYMGKLIKDGFAFMEYGNSGLIRKIDDIPELKNKLITLSELKTHIEMSKYARLLAEHILNVSGIECSTAIEECFTINTKNRVICS